VKREALAALSYPAAELMATARAQCSQIGAVRRWLDAVVCGRTHPTYSAWSRPTGAVTVSQPFGSAEDEGTPAPWVQQFVAAPKGKKLIVLQLQGDRLRWLAHLSRDPLLVQAFTSGRPPAEVIADAMGIADATGRAVISAWLEALCAGDGPRAVARIAGCRQKEAQAVGEQLRRALLAVFRLNRHLEQAGHRRGWVQTPLGRRRRFEPRYTAREALSEILATAECDVFKLGLHRLWDLAGPRLVFAASRTAILEVDQDDADEIAREARQLMALPCGGLPWPSGVGVWVVPRWSDAPPGGPAST
jgi:DNA polymerase-1